MRRVLLVCLLSACLGAEKSSAAVSFVQSKNFTATGPISTTVSVTFTSNVSSGNAIVGGVTWGSSTATVSVADTLGNSYTVIQTVADAGNNQSAATFYSKNISGGADTVTATFSQSIDFREIAAHEYSGAHTVSLLDGNAGQAQSAPGTGTDAITSGSFTTSNNNDMIVGFSFNDGGLDETLSAGTGFTLRENPPLTNGILVTTEDKIQSASGSTSCTFTTTVNQSHITLGFGLNPAPTVKADVIYGATLYSSTVY